MKSTCHFGLIILQYFFVSRLFSSLLVLRQFIIEYWFVLTKGTSKVKTYDQSIEEFSDKKKRVLKSFAKNKNDPKQSSFKKNSFS